MAKSGASDFICDSLGAKKLGRHTNLYVVSDQIGQTIDAGRPKASLLSRGSCSQASSGLTANSSFLVADAPNGRQTHAVTRRRPLTCSTLRRHSKSLNLSAYSTSSWYKSFTIIEVAKMGNAAFKEFGRKYPNAEVTAKNLPLTSDQLRKKLGCKSGGDVHIFALRVDYSDSSSENLLIAVSVI